MRPTIVIADADGLVRARTDYSTVDKAATWPPWAAIGLPASGVCLARDHRRALVATGLGFAVSMPVLAAAPVTTRSVPVNSVPSRSSAPTSAAYDIVVGLLRDGLRTLLVVCLAVLQFPEQPVIAEPIARRTDTG